MGGTMNGITGAARLRRTLAIAVGAAMAVPGAGAVLGGHAAQAATLPQVAPAQADASTPTTVTTDALPTWQVNGVVWKQAVAGTTVYAVGSFTKTRPPGVPAGGAGEVDAHNIVAYDITTGERIASFAPQLNGQALTAEVSPDGSTLYIGGDFTMVDGQARNHLAAFSTATGQLTSWAPSTDGQVRALVATPDSVYAGGNFRSASGQPRSRLAAFAAGSGAIRPWAPVVDDGFVWAMAPTPGNASMVVGGSFTQLGGTPQYGMGKVDATTGAVLPWAASARIRTAGSNGAITSLRTDGTSIYGTGYSYADRAAAMFEGSFAADPVTGAIRWVNDCLGDTYDAYPFAGALYTASHAHDCSTIGGVPDTDPQTRWQSAQASPLTATGTITVKDQYGWDFTGLPTAGVLAWNPSMAFGNVTASRQAAWTIVGSGDYLAFGGEFPRVNGVAQQGLTRYALPAAAPRKIGPTYVPGSDPVATSTEAGVVRVSFAGLWDRDDATLTYDLYRDSTKITTISDVESRFWNQPNLGFSDTGRTPGASHRYQVRVTDSAGNTQWSAKSAPVIVAGTPAPAVSAYERAVRLSGATHLWRLAEANGSTVAQDAIGYADVNASSVTFGDAGALTPANRAAALTATGSRMTTRGGEHSGDAVSVEAWVKTANRYTRGGRIIGLGDSASGTSFIRDRVLHLDNNGRVNFSVMTDQRFTARSSATVNNGQWHHVVGTYADGRLSVYVDGVLSGQTNNVPAPRQLLGYWRLGADNTVGLANRPSNQSIVGSVDEVAVYPTALPLARIQAHRLAGIGQAQNELPTAAFTSTVTGLGVALDGSDSSDPDGTIASYAWTFGDGQTGTGVNATHTYAAAGSYDVTLKVTDDKGATATKTSTVTVAAPQDPVAAFTSTVTGLGVALDASGSSDPDGTIASYAWTFGDGATGTGVNAAHTYATPGSYDVTLTVTDDSGATATKTESVTVAAPSVFATDAFERTGTGTWGSADLGGAWVHTGPATRWSVAGGAGVATLGAGNGHYARLPIEQADTSTTLSVSTDQAASGGGFYFSVLGRYRPGAGDYRLVLRMTSTGAVTAGLTKSVGGAESTVKAAVTTPITYAAGDTLMTRFEVVGSAPTTLRGKVWTKGEAEPAEWTVTATDVTPELATPGAFAVYPYVSGSATTVPVAYAIDDLRVEPVAP